MEKASSITANDIHAPIDSRHLDQDPDPEMKIIQAGDELLDALDDAFAEFDQEHFDFDMDNDMLDNEIDASSALVSGADELLLDNTDANANANANANADDDTPLKSESKAESELTLLHLESQLESTLEATLEAALGPSLHANVTNPKELVETQMTLNHNLQHDEGSFGPSASTSTSSRNDILIGGQQDDSHSLGSESNSNSNSMQEMMSSNSRVSDPTNTEVELERELEKRVSEWIAKADSDSSSSNKSIPEKITAMATATATAEREADGGTRKDKDGEEKKDCPTPTSTSTPTPILMQTPGSALLQTPVPMSSVRAVPHFVSPLAMEDKIFSQCEDRIDTRIVNGHGEDYARSRSESSSSTSSRSSSSSRDIAKQDDLGQEMEEQEGCCMDGIQQVKGGACKEVHAPVACQEPSEYNNRKDAGVGDDDENDENESSCSDNQDNEWDFDDVESLPSDAGTHDMSAATSNEIIVNENTCSSQQHEQHESANFLNEIAKSGPLSSPCTKHDEKEEVPINFNSATPLQDHHDHHHNNSKISPSPNDVASVDTMSFFQAQQEAQSNVEDVLSLSLEVQKLQEQIEKEKENNAVVRRDLEAEKMKRTELEGEMKKRRKEHADAQHIYCDDIQELMAERQHAKVKIQAAEFDAQEALELAQLADESRSEMEDYLERALDEVERLRDVVGRREHSSGQQQQLPIIAEDDTALESENRSHNGGVDEDHDLVHTPNRFSPRRLDRRRAGVSAGRALLRQVMDQDEVSFASTLDGSLGSNTTDTSYFITLTRKSAEKRQRLVNRLKRSKEESPAGKDVVILSSLDREGLDLNYTNAVSKSMQAIASIIRKSGRSLGLGGRWFSKRSSRLTKTNEEEELDVETMTKSYCKSLETLVTKQKEEFLELKAFCDYLEEKV